MRLRAGTLSKALLLHRRLRGRGKRRRPGPRQRSIAPEGDEAEGGARKPREHGARPREVQGNGSYMGTAEGRAAGMRQGQTGSASGESGSGSQEGDDDDAEDAEGAGTAVDAEDEEEAEEAETLTVDFDVFAPKEEDFHGVRALLGPFLDDEEWDAGLLADAVLKAGAAVGSVVKAGEEGYVLGFISCLPLINKAKGWPGVVQRFVQSRCDNLAVWESTWEAMQNAKTGLLLFERVVNLPPQLIPPLYCSLFEELQSKARAEGASELYGVAAVVVLSRVHRQSSSVRHRHRPQPQHPALEGGGNLEFIKPEDELLIKMARTWFTFPLHSTASATQQAKGFTMVGLFMLINVGKNVDTFLSHLQKLCETENP